MPDSPSRRRVLRGAGVAFAAALAGCNGNESSSSPTASSTSASTSSASTAESTAAETAAEAGTGTEAAGEYTEVYRNVIDSVVLIQVSSGGQGSGFVYRDNFVVTNAHVVGDASEVQVRFTDGEWRSASVVGVDPSADLAVVRVENRPDDAEPLPMVDEQPAIGTEVVAIGNPYGLEGSVTSGLVSGVNRLIPAPNGYRIPDAIQTGAPVNPGNSGGPLVTLDGEVVGVINSGGGENLAFAISAALVKRVVPALIEDGEYRHAYMGAALRTVTPNVAEQLGLSNPRGVLVTDVLDDGPSDDALQAGDVVVSVGGERVDSRQQLASYLALRASPGDSIRVAVLRDGRRQRVEFTLGTRPRRPDTTSR
ncbi:trypsin-like peptidase domain-containing protein [Halogeometricum sp. S1BR25-6]|uniref:Trypsin-like peptidase domain-containing protein n=1 Tax=Halogeometricum salsisoli TaxID=2950536 RepID=A0ABU2GH04_9EURY|nr:trypsin-like peptidase domain-containing protein [Halogeometricum sp. S1BR25-6]MDS0300059.1 trypsin-like peptidase domain-containing protein [Halogeometricum sp. S1BR25-6]